MSNELRPGVYTSSPRPSRSLPALYGQGRVPFDGLPEHLFAEVRKHWNEFKLSDEAGTWSFRIDICEEDKVGVLDGDLHDLLTLLFRDLMDLRRFLDATYSLVVPFHDTGVAGSMANVTGILLTREVVAMCAALGMGIEVYQPPVADTPG